MSAIVFDRVDEMHIDLLVIIGCFPVFSFIDEGVVFVDLIQFEFGAILPLRVAVLLVDLDRLCLVLRYKEAIHVLGLFAP